MIQKINILDLRFYTGAKAGLSQKTALVTLDVEGDTRHWGRLQSQLAAKAESLWPSEPLYGVSTDSWPATFVQAPLDGQHFSQWVVALTIAIQRWARDPVWQGCVLAQEGSYIRLALPWERQEVLTNALQTALHHLLLWTRTVANPEQIAKTSTTFADWLTVAQKRGIAPNTLRFAQAAWQRNIPTSVMVGMLFLGWGRNSQRLDSSFTGQTSNTATYLARNKNLASQLLHAASIPVPPTGLAQNWATARGLALNLGWPVVIKPADQDQGLGVVPGIRDEISLRQAFKAAIKLSAGAVIVEKHIKGDDYRMLVVGGKLLMVTRRIPAGVLGDGVRNVTQLIAAVNSDPLRGKDKRSLLIQLILDGEAQHCLTEQGLTADEVPATGRFVHLRRIANISTGGTAVDVTNRVHLDNRLLAERAARIIGLDIAGVDFLCPDISRSWREVGGAICEINAQPGFRVHWLGDDERDINGEVIDWLFQDKPARIPTAAITGTNGKSTVALMLHHIWMTAGRVAGVCTTQGVWVGDALVSDQNLSGCPGGRILLTDPAVEAAVIEMPRKGLIRFGHPCDRYDVAALLNVQDDHIGSNGIESLNAMANLKAEVLARASQAIVVNAEDLRCLAMREQAGTRRHILVAQNAETPALQQHLAEGGAGVFAQLVNDTPWIILAEGTTQTELMPLAEIPATMNGLLPFNESNALFATALAWAQDIALDTIRQALTGFANTPSQNPGRYNFINGYPFQLLLDFAHNPEGIEGLCAVVARIPVKGKRRLVCLNLGNRIASHLSHCTPLLARNFDSFVLGQDADRIAQSTDWSGDDPCDTMLKYFHNSLHEAGVSDDRMLLEPDKAKAIRAGLAMSEAGDLLVLMAEPGLALPIVG